MKMNFNLAELSRRLSNLIRKGKVYSVNAAAATCRVQSGDLISAELPWLTRRAAGTRDWWAPEIGEQVLLLCPEGDPAQGVVLPALYQTAHAAPSADPAGHVTDYGDGTVITYNKITHKLSIECTGDIELHAGGNISIGGPGGPAVARVGDMVNVGAGSSAGQWPIVTGSPKVSAT